LGWGALKSVSNFSELHFWYVGRVGHRILAGSFGEAMTSLVTGDAEGEADALPLIPKP